MSGPIWKKIDQPAGRCALCLRETAPVFAEGRVAQGDFHVVRTLCSSCFAEHNALIQKSPQAIGAKP